MGAKHEKYIYVSTNSSRIYKFRTFKGRSDTSPEKYIVVGRVAKVPRKGKTLKVEELPKEVKESLL